MAIVEEEYHHYTTTSPAGPSIEEFLPAKAVKVASETDFVHLLFLPVN